MWMDSFLELGFFCSPIQYSCKCLPVHFSPLVRLHVMPQKGIRVVPQGMNLNPRLNVRHAIYEPYFSLPGLAINTHQGSKLVKLNIFEANIAKFPRPRGAIVENADYRLVPRVVGVLNEFFNILFS